MNIKAVRMAGILGATAAVILAGPLPAQAGIANDANLVDPPGYYNGSGNPNGGFTIDTEGAIEVGLRAKTRFGAVVTPVGNVYTVQTGTSAGGRATWNYEFSVNLRAGGGTSVLSGVSVTLGVSKDGGAFTTVPITHWADNAYWGGSGSGSEFDASGTNPPDLTSLWGVQNSENIVFGDTPGGPFSPWVAGNYEFQLTVSDPSGRQLAQSTIHVNAVPEPATLALFGVGLLGLGLVRRRKTA